MKSSISLSSFKARGICYTRLAYNSTAVCVDDTEQVKNVVCEFLNLLNNS